MTEPSPRLATLAAVLLAAALASCGGVPPPETSWDLPDPQGRRLPSAGPAVEAAEQASVIPELGRPVMGSAPMALGMGPTGPSAADVVALLDGDTEAQRFLVLARLFDDGLVTPEDMQARRSANLGALLPFSTPPPAAGLERAIPPVPQLVQRLAQLARGSGPTNARASERAYLLDQLLPRQPRQLAPPVRTDTEALRLGKARVERLANAGLVTPDERARELDAISRGEQLIAATPLPPPKPKPKAKPKPKTELDQFGAGPVSIHLLSMAAPKFGDMAWQTLSTEYPALAPLEHRVVETKIPDLGTTYRLLAGPLPTKDAIEICKPIREKGQSCALTKE
ncbi:MAG: SPOR domain-containing protein [Actinomycetota bacterium]